MPQHARSNRGKWLAAAVVLLGLVGALAGLKFRVFTPKNFVPPSTAPAR